jgi:UDPglucose 6-dehydrogenase
MKVGIIGYGFVGKAIHSGLKKNVQVLAIDPKLNTNISNLIILNPDIIFVSVPTPVSSDGISQDISILEQTISEIKKNQIDSLVVIKSTVLPSHLDKIYNKNKKIVYNPEFLREKTANEDFINSNLIIFGGKKELSKTLASFYKNHTKCKCTEYTFTDIISASLIKYTINTFLSTKVIFFNELKNLFDISGSKISWNDFISALSRDDRIGYSHMQVPGHDGRKGFGGACLPKDSYALLKFAEKVGEPLTLLEKVVEINSKIRSSYSKQTKREISQNIKFNKSND